LKSQTLYKKEANLDSINEVAKDILKLLPKSAIVFLNGNLSAGKTTFVNYLTKSLNLSSATSPTFSLQQIYNNRVFHYDFYRVDFSEIANLGLLDEFEKEGLHLIEWAMDELKTLLIEAGFKCYNLNITPCTNGRVYELKALNA